ncbi:SAM-dependent methyltransferase [Jidongwangia harbinensis]|uniref:SAM-dependent methyltransferase n=1 Tax=Jidongwangia harbinensis TaxID=2878561 RepID=UPI001CDA2424|nr:methyltransferase domain-containing protein [Jidongwangia harbinensis]MCA2219238.1 methyltransferase domain-containing protein [Jidongwangia harbinensis]
MTSTETPHETLVRRFYDDAAVGGEGAGEAYTALMEEVWHHGDLAADRDGVSPLEAAVRMERQLMTIAGVGPGDHVLDFGSGPGGATVNMAEMTGATFVGVSNSESLSQRARRHAADRGLRNLARFATIGDLDYRDLALWPDASFDAVTFFESVCHLPDKAAFFRAAARTLKPGGRLVGLDWLQRPFGEHQSEEQIRAFIDPVCEHIRLAPGGLGTLEGYAELMRAAGLRVTHAVDAFPGEPCWGSTPPEDREAWLTYSGPSGDVFQRGKRALDAARGAGVFTVGWWAATRPATV